MTFVDECLREWKRLGVPDAIANEMAVELTADLAEAEAEGASPEDVLGYAVFDARAFAAQWAAERGVIGREPEPRRRSFPIALVVALAVFLAVTAAGVALLAGRGTATTRIAIGPNFRGPRIQKLIIPAPKGPFSKGGRVRIAIAPGPFARKVQFAALPSPPATAGLVFLGVGIGGIVVTLGAWLVLDRRRVIL